MEPFLSNKALIPFKPATFSDIVPEDIAIIKVRGVYLVHRVISKFRIGKRSFFIHKGDTGKIPLLAPSCALAGKAVLKKTRNNFPMRNKFVLSLKILLIKFKLWLKLLLAVE